MGYSTNPDTLEKIREKLANLEAGNPCRWRTAPGGAGLFRYKILEALYIARMYSSRYPKLAQAASKFSIRVLTDSLVAAESKSHFELSTIYIEPEPGHPTMGSQTEIPVLDISQDRSIPSSILEVSSVSNIQLGVSGFQTEFTIISEWTKGGFSRSLYFPDAALTTHQLTRLFKWAKVQTPELMILQEDTGSGLTLALLDPDVADLQWTPET